MGSKLYRLGMEGEPTAPLRGAFPRVSRRRPLPLNPGPGMFRPNPDGRYARRERRWGAKGGEFFQPARPPNQEPAEGTLFPR